MVKHIKVISERNQFGDLIVYRTQDEFGDILVIDCDLYRNLTFDSGLTQSSIDLRKPNKLVYEYTHAMMLVTAFVNPRHITILGLGGGCLLRSIRDVWPESKIHVVELRQRVYDVAVDYFGIPDHKNTTISIMDAEQHLMNAKDASSTIIFADMFTAYCMNPFQMQQHFIKQCYRGLSHNGWLVINYHELTALEADFFTFMRSIFADVYLYKTLIGNNNIIFASKCEMGSLSGYARAVRELEKKLGNRPLNLFNRLIHLCEID